MSHVHLALPKVSHLSEPESIFPTAHNAPHGPVPFKFSCLTTYKPFPFFVEYYVNKDLDWYWMLTPRRLWEFFLGSELVFFGCTSQNHNGSN